MVKAMNVQKPSTENLIGGLSERAREVFRHIVDAYVESGEPIGSRTLSRRLGLGLSPATIRNVMSDLEDAGLLQAPHTSAGRMPTDLGLRLFVDGLLQLGDLSEDERRSIDAQCNAAGRTFPEMLEQASTMLSGLSNCAGLVVAPKAESALKHIEFVRLGPGRALVVLVTEDNQVENRLIDLPMGLPAASLIEAGNYLSSRLTGRTVGEARADVLAEITQQRAELDQLAARVVEAGLASWGDGGNDSGGVLIVRGQSHLLDDVQGIADLERVRGLFAALETKDAFARLLGAAEQADGIRIFIGAQNELFGLTGCSLVIAPYRSGRDRVVGAIGVIGPMRIDYARIIPMVDYTAKMIGRLVG